MASDHQLLEHAESLVFSEVTGRRRPHHGLDVYMVWRERVVDGKRPALTADLEFALPHAVTPLGMDVPQAEHLEVVQRLEADRRGSIGRRREVDLERGGRSRPRFPFESVVDVLHLFGSVVADRRDEAAPVPALAVRVLVDVEVGRELLEVERRPQPEELRVGDGRAGRPTLSDRTDAP